MAARTFNATTQEAEAELYEFEVSRGYIGIPCLKKKFHPSLTT